MIYDFFNDINFPKKKMFAIWNPQIYSKWFEIEEIDFFLENINPGEFWPKMGHL